MSLKKQSEIINRLIAEVKLAVLQLNKNTTTIKGKQGSLSQDQLNILGGNVFTTAEKNKLAQAITDLSAYTTTTALTQLLAGKQASLTHPQLNVVNSEPFTGTEKNFLASLQHGGRFLGDLAADAGQTSAQILSSIRTTFGGNANGQKDANLNEGDHIEVIQSGANAGDLTFTTYTYRSNGLTYDWNAGAVKTEHIKGGSVDAYTRAEADGRFAPIGDVSMDDASILALEAITITQ